MLSAIVTLPVLQHGEAPARPAERFVRTLASLVPAGVSGLLRDVVIAGPRGIDLSLVGDHAGCAVCEGANEPAWLGAALAAVRQPQVFLLQAGFAVGAEFFDELADLLAAVPQPTRLRAAPDTFVQRLFPASAPAVGLLGPTTRLRVVGGANLAAIAAAAGRRATFHARARRVL